MASASSSTKVSSLTKEVVLDINGSAKMGQAWQKGVCRSNFVGIWVVKTRIGFIYLFAIIGSSILYGQGLAIDKGLSGSDTIAIVKDHRVIDSLGTIYDQIQILAMSALERPKGLCRFNGSSIIIIAICNCIEFTSSFSYSI